MVFDTTFKCIYNLQGKPSMVIAGRCADGRSSRRGSVIAEEIPPSPP